MLLASHKKNGVDNEYYGIDIDRTCAKMAALNLFLHGMWHGEVMCANALSPDDFVISYRISMLPLGIFKIENKEDSRLWHLHRNSFTTREKQEALSRGIELDQTPFNERKPTSSNQLYLF
jgi:type I restriction-modification system DNA methylase subunit